MKLCTMSDIIKIALTTPKCFAILTVTVIVIVIVMEKNMKYSRQRELILSTVQSFPIHPTADTVYESVRQREPKISLGTVYRNLNQLSDVGILLKLPMPYGGDRFDGRLDDHLHIICSLCSAVSDIELSALSQLDTEVEHQTGYCVTGRTMVFSGICGECRKKS